MQEMSQPSRNPPAGIGGIPDPPRVDQAEYGIAAHFDRGVAVSREEHASSVSRLRMFLQIACFAWPALLLADWVVVTWLEPVPLWHFLALRASMLPVFAVGLRALSQVRLPTPQQLDLLDLGIFFLGTVAVSFMCLKFRGIESPYAVWILVLMIARAATRADHWHRGLVSYVLQALSFPLVCGLAARLSPRIEAQFGNAQAVAIFGLYSLMLIVSAGVLVATGHTLWAVRREAYAARHLGLYKLEYPLARGAMGEVWVAHHHGLKRNVALKLLKSDRPITEQSIARFEREVRATSRLTHPNTIRIMDFGVTPDGIWYYVMELLEGTDMATLVERGGPIAPARAIYLMRQVCASLSEAHRLGIVHRDLKPENLFITHMGGQPDFVKVLDFGIAKVTQEKEGDRSQEDVIAGTPRYMAPEVIMGKEADARSDVYALGAVLYFLLCGRPLFHNARDGRLLYSQLEVTPELPSRLLERPLPPDLEGLVMACLSKSPADRFADAAELGEALSTCDDAGEWVQGRLARLRAEEARRHLSDMP